MKIYIVVYADGSYKAFSSLEKLVKFVIAEIHHLWESLDDNLKPAWGSEEILLSEFKRDGGIEDAFYTLEIPFDDFEPTEWF